MTKSLYEDALADAKELRELAEEAAKKSLIESITPQIRDMVNRRLLGEDISMEDLEDLDNQERDPVEPMVSMDDLPDEPMPEEIDGPVVNIDAAGDVNIDLSGSSDDDDDDEPVLTSAMAENLMKLIGGHNSKDSALRERLENLEERFSKLKDIISIVSGKSVSADKTSRIHKSYSMCVKEAHKIHKQLILKEQATQGDLEQRLTIMIKEMKNMSKSNSRNIFDFLFEGEGVDEGANVNEAAPALAGAVGRAAVGNMIADKVTSEGDLEEAELSIELSDDEREELADAEDVAAVDAALEDILGDLEVSMDAEEAPAGEDEEPEAEEEGDEEDEGGEDDEDMDLPEGDHMEGDHMEETKYEADTVYEIDENMLREALSALNEEAADEADQFGGGELGDEMFVDVDEEDLINALADELGSVSETGASAPEVAAESRNYRAMRRELNQARLQLEKYDNTVNELKKQLVEMNLFNAKLLYANKLMQNKDLTIKQQKTIVEALDNAQTISEAKLLFKTLSESLKRRKGTKNLQESKILGSSSKVTKSGQTQKADPEAARWAVLAGIKS